MLDHLYEVSSNVLEGSFKLSAWIFFIDGIRDICRVIIIQMCLQKTEMTENDDVSYK